MAEADLILAKAFLLFAVAGYTTAALNADPQSARALQTLRQMAASLTDGDRAADAARSGWAEGGDVADEVGSGFPLHLGQRPVLFPEDATLQRSGMQRPAYSEQPAFLSAVLPASSLSQTVKQDGSVELYQPAASSLTLPPVLAEAGFQFQL